MKKIMAHWRIWLTLIITVAILLFMWSCYFFNIHIPTQITPTATSTVITTAEVDEEVVINPVPLSDYLSNPGMGWQNDLSVGASSGYFPETVIYSSREKIAWNSLNPKEGVYDWSALDEQLNSAIAQGKQFSFRVYTMRGESFGGNQAPDWVLNKGAIVLPSGELDYSNCVYQQEWGRFVSALIAKYDGNPAIAYMDISGYGNFNEWNWNDQTEWDSLWESSYKDGIATAASMRTLDSQSRRRLVDIFIGGTVESHQCRASDGSRQTVRYSYAGVQATQLVMPYAGITQSTQYVFLRRKDVGFRYDCLGRQDDLPDDLSQIWRNAPVIYELCSSDEFNADVARVAIQTTHPILIHNNDYQQSLDVLLELMTPVGYRFFLKEIKFNPIFRVNSKLVLEMTWQNLGTSIPYEKMGQHLSLHLYLVRQFTDQVVFETVATDADPAVWLPSDPILSVMPADYKVNVSFVVPDTISAGEYSLEVALLDERTGMPVQLAMDGLNGAGRYDLSVVKIIP